MLERADFEIRQTWFPILVLQFIRWPCASNLTPLRTWFFSHKQGWLMLQQVYSFIYSTRNIDLLLFARNWLHILKEILLFRTYKAFLNLNTKKTNDSTSKWQTWTDTRWRVDKRSLRVNERKQAMRLLQ